KRGTWHAVSVRMTSSSAASARIAYNMSDPVIPTVGASLARAAPPFYPTSPAPSNGVAPRRQPAAFPHNKSSCSGLTRASTSFLRARPPRRKAWILGSSPRMTNGRRGDTLARFLLPSGAFELQADPEREGAMAEGGRHHHVPATDKTVHWGYFSKALKPI